MAEIWDLSTTDASNNDSAFGFPEGMNPSDVNDNLRRILGALARYYGDTNGALVSAGTGSAYTLASNRSLTTSYSDGQVFVFQANAASANGATLNVDGKGAKAILKRGTTTVSASDILADQIVAVAYESNNDKWQMLSPISGKGEAVGGFLLNVVEDTTPQLGGNLDVNGNGITFPGATVTDVTGADTTLISGTAGTNGNLIQFNADGDAVDSGVAASSIGSPTKEFFVAANLRGIYSTPYGAVDGIWPVARAQSGNDNIFFTFKMPADFSSLTHVKIGVLPDATETITYNINTNFAAVGEARTTHTDSIVAGSDGVTHDQLYEIDISAAFTGVAAGDWCAVEMDSAITLIQCLGLTVKYT